jgi:hypothetical protein
MGRRRGLEVVELVVIPRSTARRARTQRLRWVPGRRRRSKAGRFSTSPRRRRGGSGSLGIPPRTSDSGHWHLSGGTGVSIHMDSDPWRCREDAGRPQVASPLLSVIGAKIIGSRPRPGGAPSTPSLAAGYPPCGGGGSGRRTVRAAASPSPLGRPVLRGRDRRSPRREARPVAGRPGASPPHPVPADGVPSRPRRPRGTPGAGRQSEAEALNEFHGLRINLAAMLLSVLHSG